MPRTGRASIYYKKHKCSLCGMLIGGNGFAEYNHRMKHVREGLLVPARGRGFDLTDEGRKILNERKSAKL